MYNIQIDTHVHSVLSGHAWSTLRENILQAGKVGLKGFCITEHSGAVPGAAPEWSPVSMAMLPTEEDGLRLYHGLEADILSPDGKLCPSDEFLSKLEFCIASMHIVAAHFTRTVSACTEAYLCALENPYVSVLGHVDRVAFPCDLEAVVRKAHESNKLIELNNASLIPARASGHQNVITLIKLCKQYDVPVCVSSDAHYYTMVGDFNLIEAALTENDFPAELIANQTKERFDGILRKRQESIEEYNRRKANAEINREFVY
jgi:putative hydrolase